MLKIINFIFIVIAPDGQNSTAVRLRDTLWGKYARGCLRHTDKALNFLLVRTGGLGSNDVAG